MISYALLLYDSIYQNLSCKISSLCRYSGMIQVFLPKLFCSYSIPLICMALWLLSLLQSDFILCMSYYMHLLCLHLFLTILISILLVTHLALRAYFLFSSYWNCAHAAHLPTTNLPMHSKPVGPYYNICLYAITTKQQPAHFQ